MGRRFPQGPADSRPPLARHLAGPVGHSRPWSWGLGAALGYNFIIGRHFTFQIGAGGGFTDYGDVLVWSPRLRLGIGAAF